MTEDFNGLKIIRPGSEQQAATEPVVEQQQSIDNGVVDEPQGGTPPIETPQVPVATDTPQVSSPDFDTIFKEKVGGKYERLEDLLNEYQSVADKAKRVSDPWLDKLVDEFNAGADLTPYIHAKSMNYDTLALEDLARLEIQQKYPTASREITEGLLRQKLEQYGIEDPENQDPLGKFKFETEMNEFRDKLKTDQQKYMVPASDQRQSQTREAQEALKQQIETFNAFVDSHSATKSVIQDKKITVKYGDEDVNVGIDNPSELVGFSKDTNEFLKLFVSEDGSADIAKFLRVAAYAKNPTAFETALINFGKTKGTTAVIDKLQNPVEINPNGATVTNEVISMKEGIMRALKNQ